MLDMVKYKAALDALNIDAALKDAAYANQLYVVFTNKHFTKRAPNTTRSARKYHCFFTQPISHKSSFF